MTRARPAIIPNAASICCRYINLWDITICKSNSLFEWVYLLVACMQSVLLWQPKIHVYTITRIFIEKSIIMHIHIRSSHLPRICIKYIHSHITHVNNHTLHITIHTQAHINCMYLVHMLLTPTKLYIHTLYLYWPESSHNTGGEVLVWPRDKKVAKCWDYEHSIH